MDFSPYTSEIVSALCGAVGGAFTVAAALARSLWALDRNVSFMSGQLSQLMGIHEEVSETRGDLKVLQRRADGSERDIKGVADAMRSVAKRVSKIEEIRSNHG